jgi:hypothetical protein
MGMVLTYLARDDLDEKASDPRWRAGRKPERNLRLEYVAEMSNNMYDAQNCQNLLAYRCFQRRCSSGPRWKDALRRLPPPGVALPGGESGP